MITTNRLDMVKHVALYVRKSRDEDEGTLEKHLRTGIETCKRYGWSYTIYKEIVSGDSIMARPEMQKMLKDVENLEYDAIVTQAVDRLGRGSGTDQDTIQSALINSDVLVVECEPFNVINPLDEASLDMLDFKQFLARKELKMITRRLQAGRKIALEMGRWVGTVPYGYSYDRASKKLAIKKDEAEVIELIVELYLEKGLSSSDIAWELNKSKIPSPRNTQWSDTMVLRILKNEVYQGHIIYNKTQGSRKKKSGAYKPFVYIPKENWKYVYNAHPAIITIEQREKIDKKIKDNSRHQHGAGKLNEIYPLTGVIKCFNCNSTLGIQKNNLEDYNYPFSIKKCYNCEECRGGNLEIVEHALFKAIDTLKIHLQSSKEELDDVEFEKSKCENKLKELEKDLEKQHLAIERIEELYEEGEYSKEKRNIKLQERREKVATFEKQILDIRAQMNMLNFMTNDERIEKIEKFINDMKSHEGVGYQQNQLIKTILDNITWKRNKWDEVEVAINFL